VARILIVDDEDIVREIIHEALIPGGHEFHFADGGAKAFDLLRKKSIDLVICDRHMPGMSGVEIVELIRHNPNTAHIKVLMCTGASMIREIDEAFAAGADDYIIKPINFEKLTQKVARVLALPKDR
jgi:CheY-like chemotaxis protein